MTTGSGSNVPNGTQVGSEVLPASTEATATDRLVGSSDCDERNLTTDNDAIVDIEIDQTDSELPTLQVLFKLWRIAAPAMVASFFLFASQMITTMFVGHRLGAKDLEYMAAGVTSFNVCGISIGIGFVTALDTLASQSYGRDPEGKEIGELLQRALFVCGLLAMPCITLFVFAQPVLNLVFSAELAAGAAIFLHNSYIYLMAVFVHSCLMALINACGLTHVPLYGNVAMTLASAVLNYYFLSGTLASAVWILTAGTFVNIAVLVFFLCTHPKLIGVRKAPWPAPALFDLGLLKKYCKVGIAAMIAVCAEWWAFEALLIIAAQVSDEAVGVMQLVFQIFTVFFLTSSGLSRATSATVGNALGAKKPLEAQRTARLALCTICGTQLITASTILIAGKNLWKLWTDDPDLLKHANIIPLMALSNILDGFQFLLQGIFRGAGKQDKVAPRVLVSLWAIGVAGAAVLAIPLKLGVTGIILGLITGMAFEIPLLLLEVRKWDWNELAKEAAKNCSSDDATPSEHDSTSSVTPTEAAPTTTETKELHAATKVIDKIPLLADSRDEIEMDEVEEDPHGASVELTSVDSSVDVSRCEEKVQCDE